MPHVCRKPALTVAKARGLPPPGPVTADGLSRRVVVLSPSCPRSLYPQQYSLPAVVMAQLWSPPPETTANVTPGGAATGTGDVLQRIPSHTSVAAAPSSPEPLFPQQS